MNKEQQYDEDDLVCLNLCDHFDKHSPVPGICTYGKRTKHGYKHYSTSLFKTCREEGHGFSEEYRQHIKILLKKYQSNLTTEDVQRINENVDNFCAFYFKKVQAINQRKLIKEQEIKEQQMKRSKKIETMAKFISETVESIQCFQP